MSSLDKREARRSGGVTRTVNAGFAHHQAGRLDRAAALYRKALAKDPHHAEALHLLGVVAYQRGNLEESIALIEQAMPGLRDDLPEAHLNLGNALQGAGRLTEAADSYRRAIALNPGYGMAHTNLARALNDQGRFEAGLESAMRAGELIPDFLGVHVNRAAALMGLGRMAEAETSLRRALDLMPERAETHYNLGRVLTALRRLDEAVESYQRAVALGPNYPEVHFNLGNAFYALRRFDKAAASYRRAIQLNPGYADALNNRGVILKQFGRFEEALESYNKALALRPGYPDALKNRGGALQELGRFEEALESYDKALALRPDDADVLNNRGVTLKMLGRLEEALESYDKALALRPGSADTLNNRGAALLKLAHLDEALEHFEGALASQPDLAETHLNRSMVLLLRGDFARGWAEYEWRWRGKTAPGKLDFGGPRWSGECLDGKTILLHAEQGFGDTFQFVRFVPVLAAGGARVMLLVPERIRGLLRAAGLPVRIVEGPQLPNFNFHLPLLSVPCVLGTAMATIPAEVPYLSADPARIAAWRERLPKADLRIGIAWQGNPEGDIDRGRSIPLRSFAPAAALPGMRVISLQRNDGLDQLDALPEGMRVERLGPDFDAGPDAFLDTAAIMMSLDLVVTSDTAVAHLAGALGRPVWIALRHIPDWRWMLEREDSPWYPTARLFRQRRPGDWDEAFARIAAELARVASGERNRLLPQTRSVPADDSVDLAPRPEMPPRRDVDLPTATVLKDCRHGRMLFLRRDCYIGRSLDLYGEYSELEAAIFAQLLRSGDVVVEVGSNIGVHTVPIANLVGRSGLVLAFEPQRVIFQLLCANVALNEFFNVRTYHGAVGRETGTVRVPYLDYTNEVNFGGVSMNKSGTGEEVTLWKLDALSLQAVKMLKVDVEGMELEVLEGARQTITKFRPVLYVENDRKAHSGELIALIGELGYEMWWHLPELYNPQNFAKNKENVFEGIVSVNLLCFPKEAAAKVTGFRRVSGPQDWWQQ
ncbi:MAG TPA: FkbM family methyltransferase [Stellaceae bacterium]|nr:FkbM family methyltransferase [Stellaceae bacterium]